MPVPNAMSDLSQLAGSNSPVGSEAIGNNLDNYMRSAFAFIKQSNSLASSTMPSGSTVNVALADAECVSITGTDTINSLGTGFNGCKRELRFFGAATLVHSSALQLPGAVNIVAVPGNVLTFRCIGSNAWVLTASSGLPVGFLPGWSAIDPATKQNALGFTPIRQGGLGNTIEVGWTGSKLAAAIDGSGIGNLALESWVTSGFLPTVNPVTNTLRITTPADTSRSTLNFRADALIFQNGAALGDYAGAGSLNIGTLSDIPVGVVQNNALRARFNSSGMLVYGEVYATGQVTAFSDRRLKSDIQRIENASDLVRSLRGTTYTKDGKRTYGVVAQEVEEVMPEIVIESDSGMLGVNCGNEIPAVLIEAWHELDARLSKAGL